MLQLGAMESPATRKPVPNALRSIEVEIIPRGISLSVFRDLPCAAATVSSTHTGAGGSAALLLLSIHLFSDLVLLIVQHNQVPTNMCSVSQPQFHSRKMQRRFGLITAIHLPATLKPDKWSTAFFAS